jgi:hypothetical protein
MGGCSGKNTKNLKRATTQKNMTKLLKKCKIDSNPEFDQNFTLKLMMDVNKDGVHEFLENCNGLRIEQMRKLFMFSMEILSPSGIINCSKFMSY